MITQGREQTAYLGGLSHHLRLYRLFQTVVMVQHSPQRQEVQTTVVVMQLRNPGENLLAY